MKAQGSTRKHKLVPDQKVCFTMLVEGHYGMWLKGQVNGRSVSFQFSNNSDNFVSTAAVQRLGLQTSQCHPFQLQTPGGSSPELFNLKVANLPFLLDGGFGSCMDFCVIDFPTHDFIIGREFLDAFPDMEFGGKGIKGTFSCPFRMDRPRF